MALDLNQVQQAFLRANSNIDEMMSKFYDTFYNPTPLNITLEWTKADGTIQNVTVPNRAKIKAQMWSDINAAVGRWIQVLYVDEVNGDDNNPGTATAPFKTLTKALNSIPGGGAAHIILLSDIDFTAATDLNKMVSRDNISVVIAPDPDTINAGGTRTINFDKRNKILTGNNNRLWLKNIVCNFNMSGLTVGTSLFMWNTHIYAGDAGLSMGGGFGTWGCTININVDSDYFVTMVYTIPLVRLDYTTVNYTNSTGNDYFKIIGADHGVKLYIGPSTTFSVNGTDITNATDIASHISGLVRDANGVPRNLLCNYAL